MSINFSPFGWSAADFPAAAFPAPPPPVDFPAPPPPADFPAPPPPPAGTENEGIGGEWGWVDGWLLWPWSALSSSEGHSWLDSLFVCKSLSFSSRSAFCLQIKFYSAVEPTDTCKQGKGDWMRKRQGKARKGCLDPGKGDWMRERTIRSGQGKERAIGCGKGKKRTGRPASFVLAMHG